MRLFKKLNSRGILLLDVLVAVGIITVFMLPILQTTQVSLAAAGLAKSQLAEQDLNDFILKALSCSGCEKNYIAG